MFEEAFENTLLRGLVRRRRNLSSKLSFLEIERYVTDDTDSSDETKVLLVRQGWHAPTSNVAGFLVTAIGHWEKSPKNDSDNPKLEETSLTSTRRFYVSPGGLKVIDDLRGSKSPWSKGEDYKIWREKMGVQCNCTDPDCARNHGDPVRWEDRRRRRQQEKASLSSDIHPSGSASSKRKHNRIFVEWVVSTFGLDFLKANGVVDIAGGRGMVGLDLALDYDIPVTMIEPKSVRLNSACRRRCRRWRKKRCLPSIDDVNKLSPIDHIQSEYHGLAEATAEMKQALSKCALILGMHPDVSSSLITSVSTTNIQ